MLPGGGIRVLVTEATTGARICDATLTATDGVYAEQLQASYGDPAFCDYRTPSGRAGTYDLRVARAGYSDVLIHNVVVEQEGCDTRTAILYVQLAPK